MNNKKYQIFISSTYEDLKDEREKVRDAILSMNHFPVGMEFFGATSDSQQKIIQKTICNRIGDKVTEGMTSRIDTLLDLTGIEGRRGTEDNAYEISEPLLMKWSADMEDRLNNERKRSHEYLKSVLV